MPATLLIGYDLNRPEQNYPDLLKEIKSVGMWWHCLNSAWLIKTDLSTEQVLDRLKTKIDATDELLVIRVERDAAWTGFDEQCSNWFEQNL